MYVILGVIWLALVAAGLGGLAHYSFSQGTPAAAPSAWPAQTQLPLSPERYTLVLVAHPQCSCTRASIAELAEMMTRLRDQVDAHVLLSAPEGVDEKWAKTDLWDSANLIPNTTVWIDLGGVEADRFGAETSGQTYLFSPEGELLFSGGITPSRGHQGDSIGRRRIISIVTRGSVDRAISDVFGCPIHEEEDEEDEEGRAMAQTAKS